VIGVPTSVVMRAANSSPRSDSFAAIASIMSTRSAIGVAAQPGKASLAAETARSTSEASPTGMSAMTCSV
jgi:hypothetical protein